MKAVAVAGLVGLTVGACAKSSSDISAAYVSPLTYGSLSCNQLREEATRVSSRAVAAVGEQDSKRTNDAVATTVGVVLFWPALFLIKGDGASAAEVSRLKGEMEAVEAASLGKNCGIQFQRAAPPA